MLNTRNQTISDVDAPEAWNLRTDCQEATIAVLDTGADLNHEDLLDNIWLNTDETENALDDDANGYVDDTIGWDFVNNDNDPTDDYDPYYHGTHVLGIVAANGNNGIGTTGICWSASVMILKTLDSAGEGTVSDEIDAIDYAIENGAKIINMSFGGYGYSEAEFDAITRARDAGVLLVAAVGNLGRDNDLAPVYPACYELENIISVAATDLTDHLADLSNYGAYSVDVAAPGVSIYSTKPGDSYQYGSGTSMAAPYVSGLAALIRAEDVSLTWAEAKDIIFDGVDTKKCLEGLVLTGGRINANRSLRTTPYIEKIEPRSCDPNTKIKIKGFNFGDGTDGLVHINNKVYGATHRKVKKWTDSLIKIKIPFSGKDCSWFKHGGGTYRKRKVWVTVGDIDTNKKKVKVLIPNTCQ